MNAPYKEYYKKELDGLTVSEQYKQRLTCRLYEESRKTAGQNRSANLLPPRWLRSRPVRAVAAALCFCLLTALVIYPFIMLNGRKSTNAITNHFTSSTPSTGSTSAQPTTAPSGSSVYDAPMLTLPSSVFAEGQGCGGLTAYDIKELQESGNPWTKDAEVDTLPVYKNPLQFDTNQHITGGYSLDGIKQKLLWLGDQIHEKADVDNLQDEQSAFIAKTEDTTLKAEKSGGFGLDLNSSMVTALYGKEVSSGETGEDGREQAITKFIQQYPELFPFQKPVISTSGDYTYDGKKCCNYSVYESSGNLEEQILSFNFNSVNFYFNNDGTMCSFYANRSDSYETVGRYPIITLTQAQELLSGGKCYSSSGETPDTSRIAAVDFVYVTNDTLEYFMPYYRFYMESTEKLAGVADGLKGYDLYYVPAVPSRYFTNYDSLNLGFNR